MTVATGFAVELSTAKREVDDLIEGFRDLRGALERDGRTQAVTEIDSLLSPLGARQALLEGVLAMLGRLLDNTYPTPIPLVVSPEAAKVLAEQIRTQSLAFGSISVPTDAVDASVTVGPPVPKP